MNILAYLIGVPLGLLVSDQLHKVDIAAIREKHVAAMEARFGNDQRKIAEYEQHRQHVADTDHERRMEYMKRNSKG